MIISLICELAWGVFEPFLDDGDKVQLSHLSMSVLRVLRGNFNIRNQLPPCIRLLRNVTRIPWLPEHFILNSVDYGITPADIAALIQTCRVSYWANAQMLDDLWHNPDTEMTKEELLKLIPWLIRTRLHDPENPQWPMIASIFRLFKDGKLGQECWKSIEKR